MKLIFKIPSNLSQKKRLSIDIDIDNLVREVRLRMGRVFDIPTSYFHIVTKICGVSVLLTDSWPLSFFIYDDHPVFKVVLLENHLMNRKESIVASSPLLSSLSVGSFSNSINPLKSIIRDCKIGDIRHIREVVESRGKDHDDEDYLNEVEENKWGPLHYACLIGHSEIVKFLVEARVNCNKVSIDEWTPLQICCFFGRSDCVKELLVHPNLQINKKTRFRGTGLHLACEAGKVDIIKQLLEKDACMNINDHMQKTPIELVTEGEIFELWAVYAGQNQLKKIVDENDCSLTPFCSEVYMDHSFSLNDKQVFLYLDVETGLINRYSSKENFLDKKKPDHYIRTIDIQDVKFENRRKEHFTFSIETSRLSTKYYTKYEALTSEWVQRIKKATEFCMVNKQNVIVEQIAEPQEETPEEESTASTNPVISEGETVDFSSFTILEEIGSGSFGVVYKVKKINNGQVFAMKSLGKSMLQKQKQLKYAISECKIMKQLNHPFIVPLYFAFQTPKYLYLILELCPNGDLLGLLEKKGPLEENIARFYLAEVLLALEYLHESDIIYRDLKPANVLIDVDYHAKLADFGLAKEKVDKINPAMTMAGSPAYLPPEIIARKGASQASDIYGLGPLLYELLTCKTPYYNDNIDTLFQNIKTAKLIFPDYVSANARDLIGQLMNKDPIKRPQMSQIKRHAFFRKMDWEALLSRRIRPPSWT